MQCRLCRYRACASTKSMLYFFCLLCWESSSSHFSLSLAFSIFSKMVGDVRNKHLGELPLHFMFHWRTNVCNGCFTIILPWFRRMQTNLWFLYHFPDTFVFAPWKVNHKYAPKPLHTNNDYKWNCSTTKPNMGVSIFLFFHRRIYVQNRYFRILK